MTGDNTQRPEGGESRAEEAADLWRLAKAETKLAHHAESMGLVHIADDCYLAAREYRAQALAIETEAQGEG